MPRRPPAPSLLGCALVALATVLTLTPAGARSPRPDGPWFGVALPPPFEVVPAVIVGTRGPRR